MKNVENLLEINLCFAFHAVAHRDAARERKVKEMATGWQALCDLMRIAAEITYVWLCEHQVEMGAYGQLDI